MKKVHCFITVTHSWHNLVLLLKRKELNRLQQEERACSFCGKDREIKFISFKSNFAGDFTVEAAHKQAFLLSSLQPLGPINNNDNNSNNNDESAVCPSVLGGSAPAQQ